MNAHLPKISIITICYNSVITLEKTILSVLNQNYANLEYIIIDGGSTDGTLDIIQQYNHKINKWVSEPDQGISDAFNKGIMKATGDFIGIINSDDWYENNTFKLIAENQHRGDVLHGKIQYWRGNVKDYKADGNHFFLAKEMTIHHPTVFVRKSIYDQFGFFRLQYRYAMDYELILRFYLRKVRFFIIPEILANMSFEGASDKNWVQSINESKMAKIANGTPVYIANFYCCKQMIRTFIARQLKQTGFNKALHFYRKNFSLIKKMN